MNVVLFVIVCLVIVSTIAGTFKKDPPPTKPKGPPRSNVDQAAHRELMLKHIRKEG